MTGLVFFLFTPKNFEPLIPGYPFLPDFFLMGVTMLKNKINRPVITETFSYIVIIIHG